MDTIETLKEYSADGYLHDMNPLHERAIYYILHWLIELIEDGWEFTLDKRKVVTKTEDDKYFYKNIKKLDEYLEFLPNIWYSEESSLQRFVNTVLNDKPKKENDLIRIVKKYEVLLPADKKEEFNKIYNNMRGSLNEGCKNDSKELKGEDGMNIPKVFISYSWDDEVHKDWVVCLMNALRKEGIDAKIDQSITQTGTVNLNRMMVENIRDNDYIIIVLTDNYKKKSESYQGGVGLETSLLQNEVLSNTKKIIPIKRSNFNDDIVVPFYLKGLNYTDFSDDSRFDDSFNELLHRIKGIDLIKVEPIGTGRELSPRKVGYNTANSMVTSKIDSNFLESLIPNLKSFTDIDKKRFILESFNTMKSMIIQLCEATKCANSNFDFEVEEGNSEYSISFYLNGMRKKDLRLWYGEMVGSACNIYISYDSYSLSKSSFNEMISCEVIDDKLLLKSLMSFRTVGNNPQDIVKSIWENVCIYLK